MQGYTNFSLIKRIVADCIECQNICLPENPIADGDCALIDHSKLLISGTTLIEYAFEDEKLMDFYHLSPSFSLFVLY